MFVFLHGAGAGPWVWERVIQHLGRSGLALDYPGRVQGATPDRRAEAIECASCRHLAVLSMPRELAKLIGEESWDVPAGT